MYRHVVLLCNSGDALIVVCLEKCFYLCKKFACKQMYTTLKMHKT